jgi:hypothetical protein
MTDTEAWIDGKPAGPKHQGGFYEFRYDITALLRPGSSHQLEVLVTKESANTSVVREMANLMVAMRTFEANQRMAQLHDDRMGRAISDLTATM